MSDGPPLSPSGKDDDLLAAALSSPRSRDEGRNFLRDRARTSKRLSWILDECIRVPGTQARFGLDPLLGLVPYGGETVATIFGALILGEARRKGIPLRTLAKMGANMLLNAGVGAIPVVGDAFSFWFKSNSRNYRLLNHFLEHESGSEQTGGWWPVLLIFGTLALVLILNLLAWVLMGTLLYQAWQLLSETLRIARA